MIIPHYRLYCTFIVIVKSYNKVFINQKITEK